MAISGREGSPPCAGKRSSSRSFDGRVHRYADPVGRFRRVVGEDLRAAQVAPSASRGASLNDSLNEYAVWPEEG